jgi:hypothetical protein
MKSRIVEQGQNNERKYPYIGRSENGNVVYFTRPTIGLVLVYHPDPERLFTEEFGWAEEDFTPVTGKITIEFEV